MIADELSKEVQEYQLSEQQVHSIFGMYRARFDHENCSDIECEMIIEELEKMNFGDWWTQQVLLMQQDYLLMIQS